MGLFNFLIRPKLSEAEAVGIVRTAAAAKNWAIGEPMWVERHMGLYDGIAFIAGTEIMVIWMVDGRSGELLQLERSDELDDAE